MPLQVEGAGGRACFFFSLWESPWDPMGKLFVYIYIYIHLYLPIYIYRCGCLLSMNCVSSHFASFNVSKMLKIMVC